MQGWVTDKVDAGTVSEVAHVCAISCARCGLRMFVAIGSATTSVHSSNDGPNWKTTRWQVPDQSALYHNHPQHYTNEEEIAQSPHLLSILSMVPEKPTPTPDAFTAASGCESIRPDSTRTEHQLWPDVNEIGFLPQCPLSLAVYNVSVSHWWRHSHGRRTWTLPSTLGKLGM